MSGAVPAGCRAWPGGSAWAVLFWSTNEATQTTQENHSYYCDTQNMQDAKANHGQKQN